MAIPVPAAGQLDHRTIGALSELFAAQRPIPVTFAECCRNSGFVYLRPDPIDALTELADRLRRRRPGLTPPEGRDGEVGPHLTVAMRASEQTAEAIERETVAALPIPAELTEAWLVVFVADGGCCASGSSSARQLVRR